MVVIGVNAHKKTHTLVAVDDVGRKLAEKVVKADSDGHAKALHWVRLKFPPLRFAPGHCVVPTNEWTKPPRDLVFLPVVDPVPRFTLSPMW